MYWVIGAHGSLSQRDSSVFFFCFSFPYLLLSSAPSFFCLGICLSRQGGFEPWSLCSSKVCSALWHLLMSMLMTQALFPSLLTYLKRRAQKAQDFYFWVGSQNLFMNASRTPKGKTKWKGGEKDGTRRAEKSTAGTKSYFSWHHGISIGAGRRQHLRRQTESPFLPEHCYNKERHSEMKK